MQVSYTYMMICGDFWKKAKSEYSVTDSGYSKDMCD